MSCFAGETVYIALFSGYYVPCGYRCRYEYHCTQDIDGTSGYVTCRCRVCNKSLFHFPYGRLFPRSLYFAEVICANFLRNQCVVYAGGDDRAVRFPGDDDDICVYRSDWFRQLEYFPCYFLASVAGDAAEEERSQRVDDYGVVWRYDIPACHGCGK